jgi:hypothetical protein
MAIPSVDLPEPLSPTIARLSSASIVSSAPSSANTLRSIESYAIVRSRTSTRALT